MDSFMENEKLYPWHTTPPLVPGQNETITYPEGTVFYTRSYASLPDSPHAENWFLILTLMCLGVAVLHAFLYMLVRSRFRRSEQLKARKSIEEEMKHVSRFF